VRKLPWPLAALPAPADLPEPTPVPPPVFGSFAILIGTYDNVKEAQNAETTLREQKLSPYTIDVLMGPDDVQRRILLGRYPTREEAEAAREILGPQFTTARVIRGSQERVPVLPP
jgi:cell division septation protein DedD